jgi:phage antirepressor YoqD-like protein
MNIEEIIKDYQNGMGLYDVCAKYHIGKLKLKSILSENGVEIRKWNGMTMIGKKVHGMINIEKGRLLVSLFLLS